MEDSQQLGLVDVAHFDIEKVGVGGIPEETRYELISSYAVLRCPTDLRSSLALEPQRAFLLYGPPGTGKTRLATAMCKALSEIPPLFFNAPELLAGQVGMSEENVRNMFKPAREEWKARGKESRYHCIIIDEINHIARERGSVKGGGAADTVNDGVVTTLLTQLSGADSPGNTIVFGLCNSFDEIDDALMRSGRFGRVIHIGLPNAEGRSAIFRIHLQPVKDAGHMETVTPEDIDRLAREETQNYTGADIAEVVRKAVELAFMENVERINDVVRKHPSKQELLRSKQRELLQKMSDQQRRVLERTLSSSKSIDETASKILGEDIREKAYDDAIAAAEQEESEFILYASGTEENPQRVGIMWLPHIDDVDGFATSTFSSGTASADLDESLRRVQERVLATAPATVAGGLVPSQSRMLEEYRKDPAAFVGVRAVRRSNAAKRAHYQQRVTGRDFSFVQVRMVHLLAAVRSVMPQLGTSRTLLDPFARTTALCARHEQEIYAPLRQLLERQKHRSQQQPFMSILVRAPRRSGRTTLIRAICARMQYPFVGVLDVGHELSGKMPDVHGRFISMLVESEKAKSAALVVVDGFERLEHKDPTRRQIQECLTGSRYTGHVPLDHPLVLIVVTTGNDIPSWLADVVIDAPLCLNDEAECNEARDVLQRSDASFRLSLDGLVMPVTVHKLMQRSLVEGATGVGGGGEEE